MANINNRTKPTPPNHIPRVHAPRSAADPDEMARFVSNLNKELQTISARIDALPVPTDFNPDDFVRRDTFSDDVNDVLDDNAAAATSENTGDTGTGNETSDGGGSGGGGAEDAAAAIENAIADDAPPQVGLGDLVGTTDADDTQFAMEDHQHRGATVPRAIAFLARGQQKTTQPTTFTQNRIGLFLNMGA